MPLDGTADPDALKVIAAAVTPAVMVSACGILATGLDNQIARMTSRMRDMMKEWRTLPKESERRRLLRDEVAVLDARHVILARALRFTYGALFSFLLTSLLYLTSLWLPFSSALPIVTFALGVSMLGASSILALVSLRLGRKAIALEKRELFEDQ